MWTIPSASATTCSRPTHSPRRGSNQYQSRYGFLRPIIPEVVNKFLDCGDLERGFARIRCDHCRHEYLLAFSCKGRWFCPSCHQKKVQLFGALVTETILFPVPHPHFTLAIPKMLRPYFRYNRDLLKNLCRIAHECLLDFMRTTLSLPDGLPGIVMVIHTFGEYLDFHPHLHALIAFLVHDLIQRVQHRLFGWKCGMLDAYAVRGNRFTRLWRGHRMLQ